MIETRSTFFPETDDEGRRRRVQFTLVSFGLRPIADWKPKDAVAAEVNHGRWIARCECGGAEFADPEWPLFVCCSCGAGPLRVAFPEQRDQIEAELLKRPDVETRNWQPGESLADLRRENTEHGNGEVK